MSRKVQHIAIKADVDIAARGGEKVQAMCGQRVYPMTDMGPHIPTCTPCADKMLRDWNASPPAPRYTFRYDGCCKSNDGGA